MNEFIKNRPRRFEQINQGSLHWYKVTGLQAHRGTGSEDEIIHFVRQTNALNALEMATKKLRGWKRHRNNASSTEITDDYEINELENLLRELGFRWNYNEPLAINGWRNSGRGSFYINDLLNERMQQ